MINSNSQLNIICLESAAFYALIDEVVERIEDRLGKPPDKWIDDVEAMRRLNIKSKSTLQKYRDEGRIRYSQPTRKEIFYDSDSINEYLEKHAKETF